MARWIDKEIDASLAIVSSPSRRAKSTAMAVATQMQGRAFIQYRDSLDLASLETLINTIGEQDEATRTLMIVGHNPGLDQLVVWLCGNEVALTGSGKLMTTSARTQIEIDADWHHLHPDSARLVQLKRPRELNDG